MRTYKIPNNLTVQLVLDSAQALTKLSARLGNPTGLHGADGETFGDVLIREAERRARAQPMLAIESEEECAALMRLAQPLTELDPSDDSTEGRQLVFLARHIEAWEKAHAVEPFKGVAEEYALVMTDAPDGASDDDGGLPQEPNAPHPISPPPAGDDVAELRRLIGDLAGALEVAIGNAENFRSRGYGDPLCDDVRTIGKPAIARARELGITFATIIPF